MSSSSSSAVVVGGGGKAVAGAVNVQRRTWDRAEFEQRAKERAEREAAGIRSDEEGEEGSAAAAGKRGPGAPGAGAGGAGAGAGAGTAAEAIFRPAEAGAAGPAGSARAYIKSRGDVDLQLDARLNKRRVSRGGER
jgi:hypothetical protein